MIIIKLDYSIQSPEERKALVEKILEENPNPTNSYLEILGDYLILSIEKQERKIESEKRKLLTENRLSTIQRHETSYEGLAAQFENGEDGIYNLINEESKNSNFIPKISITNQDLTDIPFLSQVREAIAIWRKLLNKAEGKEAFIIKSAITNLSKEQYLIKEAYRKPVVSGISFRSKPIISLDEKITIDDSGSITAIEGISLLNPKICEAILLDYQRLRSNHNHESDVWFLMEDFDRLRSRALYYYPLYQRLIDLKTEGLQNSEIQLKLQEEFGIKHSLEYLSSLWRNKIPNLIAEAAQDEYLDYYFLNCAKGPYKKCSKCGQIKLAIPKNFSRNKTSKDGWYSICKDCRKSKGGMKNGRS